MEKKRYQICEREHKSAVPIDWNSLPENLIDVVNPEFIYNVLSVKNTGDLGIRSVLYFRPVHNFRKDIVIFETDELEFGV